MNTVLVLCLTLAVTMASFERLSSSLLKSPTATLKLYGDFKAKEHIQFTAGEDKLRFKLFKDNAAMVAHLNEDANEHAQFGINFFSSMTEGEKKSYLGLNVTGHTANTDVKEPLLQFGSAPSSKLWTNEGAVTAVKNQGGCGSCWTFGAVGGLETRYQQLAGRLRNFAEQEYLDCVYEGSGHDGCEGGWPNSCYTRSKALGGRLAAAADYPYTQSDGPCKYLSKPNAAIGYKIDGYTSVAASESANIAALATGSLSMAFEVTSKFQQYQGGIIKDTTCTGYPNHAVTGVGYTPNYVLVKNSWGSDWGDQGYVKFARNHGNCQLFEYSSYPLLTSTGTPDSGADDEATDYEATDAGYCVDESEWCQTYYCQYEDWASEYCQATCGLCPAPTPAPTPAPCGDQNAGCEVFHCQYERARELCQATCGICSCASGTIQCPDGICRHEHMC